MNPLDILKRIPKTNCGECGYTACLAFAANVAKSGEDPEKCPYINLDGLDLTSLGNTDLDKMSKKRDLELIRFLKSKIQSLHFKEIAPRLGATLSPETDNTLTFSYLAQEVLLSKTQLLLNGQEPEDPRDQILLYNYVHSAAHTSPTGDWVGLESLPNTISKVKTLATYCEKRLAQLFAGRPPEEIQKYCSMLHGQTVTGSSTTSASIIPVLPMVPQQLLFWDEEPEDGFEAKVKILFDARVLDHLDVESLIFSSERLADRLIQLAS
ncbi:MAG: DUF3786 domain-containing protein [Desulfobulbaceae bacterium]|uniref:DUF3786 domain-containing protein n=1 Tax=Candidatus Desulfobia pelagia TaxID=2841692 RepID=A0A8J6NB05_9BACT|nr:DUF3786 domain-containing protein [Candidatus Desulfobia pelagia]